MITFASVVFHTSREVVSHVMSLSVVCMRMCATLIAAQTPAKTPSPRSMPRMIFLLQLIWSLYRKVMGSRASRRSTSAQ